jgi:hypothetical protein
VNLSRSHEANSIHQWITLSSDANDLYTNTALPASALPDTAIAAYWDDLFIYQGTPQGVYYEVDGSAPDRSISFEWYTSHYQDPSQYYHVVMTFQEAQPDVPVFTYYDVSDRGSSATVGMQSRQAGNSAQYSFDQAVISPGLQLTYDPQSNSFKISNTVGCAA